MTGRNFKMLYRVSVAVLAGTMAVPATASAQLVPTVVETARFADCAVARNPQAAREFALSEPQSAGEERAITRLIRRGDRCVRANSLSMPRHWMRGAVAEVLLREPLLSQRLQAFPSTPPVRAAEAEGQAFVALYARCIAAAEPNKVTVLLATPINTPQERQAVLGFGQVLSDCTPHAFEYRVNVPDLRSHLAAQLYAMASPAIAAR